MLKRNAKFILGPKDDLLNNLSHKDVQNTYMRLNAFLRSITNFMVYYNISQVNAKKKIYLTGSS